MNVKRCLIVVLVLLSTLLPACERVAVTGRRQFNVIPDSMMLSMSLQNYQDFLSQANVVQSGSNVQMVRRVGARIQEAVEEYMRSIGRYDEIADYEWEFNLVQDDQINAWVMPGGKVVVYTGLLDVAQTEAGLATVMAHEIAHAIAEHGGERLSQALLVELGGVALSEALKERPQATQQLWMEAYGIGSGVGVLLPFSRLQESEADHMGLIFMAMAGYDPQEAVEFWKRMAAAKQGQEVPELLSTHPTDERRIANIQRLIPQAMEYYQPQR